MDVKTPDLFRLLFSIEVIRMADQLQAQAATMPRRDAVSKAVTALTHDLGLVQDVMEKARIE